ncbi:g1247 [Coccomyxa elongata]
MAAVGFGPGAQRWVHILHSGTTARVIYNGWHTDAFPVRPYSPSGCPLETQLRSCTTTHTSIHARSPGDAQVILDTSVDLHCAATGSKLQRGKSQVLGLGSLSHLAALDAATGVTFAAQGASVKHLGIPLSKESADAATALSTAILQKVELQIARWSGFSAQRMSPNRALHTFVAANRLVIGGTQAPLFPAKEACFRAAEDGGIARSQISALQAKVIGRLLDPEQLAWEAFFDFWLYRSPAWLSAQGQAALDTRHQHIWQLGRFLLFSTFEASRLQAPPRVRKYVKSYQQLQPHRLIQPDSLSFHATTSEPLFFSRQLRDADSLPFAWEDWARQGLVRISDLRSLVHGPAPHDASFRQRIQTLLAALPEPWHRLLRSEPPAAQWLASPDNTDRRVWSRSAAGHYTCTHTASTSGALIPVEAGAAHQQAIMPTTARPALVQGWDITRPWHPRSGASQQQQQQQQQQEQQGPQDEDSQPQQREPEPPGPYLFSIWGAHVMDPQSWGMGRRRAHEYVVKEASTPRQVLDRKAAGDEHAAAPMRPPIWADSTEDQRSGLRAIEAHWASRAAAKGTPSQVLGRRPRGQPDPSSYAAWMSPSPERQLPRRDRPQLQPRPAARIQQQVPSPDTTDEATATAEPPPPWAHVWRALHTSHLDRSQRVTAWRLLHGKLFVGAFLRRIHRPDAAGHRCPHPGCVHHAATLTHVLMTCPLAAAVWDWFAATWAAVTGEDAPPRSLDLLLANDQRTWRPASQLRPLWHSLRLATIYQLWAAYQRARHQPDAAQSAGAVAARILSSSRKALLGDWRLATVTIRQTAGVLSDWLRGRDLKLTREELRERWCHRDVLCVLGGSGCAASRPVERASPARVYI